MAGHPAPEAPIARLDWYIRANLKPRHLQLLVGLDDLRHVGRVAELLNISQPAVSKSLAEIERGVGLQLFERGRHGLVPTVYGDCMIRLSREMLQSLSTTGDELRRLQTGATGVVRLGVLPVAAPALVPSAVIRLQQCSPDAVVVLHEATADRLLPMLRNEEIDLMVGTLPPASLSSGLSVEVLYPNEGVAAVCGRQHPLAHRVKITAADLVRYPLVIPPRGTIFRELVERVMDELGISMKPAQLESGSMTASNALLRETEAIAFYSSHLAAYYTRQGWLHQLPLAVPQLSIQIGSVWLERHELQATSLAMLRALRETALAAAQPKALAMAATPR